MNLLISSLTLLALSLISHNDQEINPTFINESKSKTFIIRNNRVGEVEISTGYLLNNRFILTCAHGVSDFKRKDTTINYSSGVTINSYVQKFAGSSSPTSIKVGRSSVENFTISNIYLYPKYSSNPNFDIAIIELGKPLSGIPENQPLIKMPEVGDTIISFGYSEQSRADSSMDISNINIEPWLNLVSKIDYKEDFYFETIQHSISENKGYKYGRIAYPGDSGGPSFLIKDNEIYLSGIHISSVSMLFNSNGTTPEGFIPYSQDASVLHYEKWINSIINK